MAFNTNKSRMFVVTETTEGTPVAPSAATQAIPLEEGYSITPQFDVIDNAELKGSIGAAKPALGLENPTASIDLYLKHSAVEGQEPTYGKMLKAAFGNSETNGTAYTTSASSTAGTSSVRAVIKSTGNTSNFSRGEGLLIKDGTNGYSIRNVFSIDDANTMGISFNLANAPASGVGLGKAVFYYPADSGHPTLSLWDYRANGAAVQLMAGGRVSELSVTATAGELINASYSIEGTGFYFNPIEITSSTRYLDFLDDATTRAATVTVKTYKDPHDLADALATSMNSLGSSNTFTVTYSNTTGKFTIASNGTTLTLKWNTGANTANSIATKVGFTTAADSSAALTYTSANAYTLTSPYTPSFDAADPLIAKNAEAMIGSFYDYTCPGVQSLTFTVTNELTPVKEICSESGKSGTVITKRRVSVEAVLNPTAYDAEKFKRLRAGTDTSFCFNAGEKSGGNWVAGKCINIYCPTMRISEFSMDDADGLVVANIKLDGYVDSSGNGEVYLNFL